MSGISVLPARYDDDDKTSHEKGKEKYIDLANELKRIYEI